MPQGPPPWAAFLFWAPDKKDDDRLTRRYPFSTHSSPTFS